jgi:hypothetical protein
VPIRQLGYGLITEEMEKGLVCASNQPLPLGDRYTDQATARDIERELVRQRLGRRCPE